MTAVLNELDRIKKNELAALWTKNEAEMLAKAPVLPPIDLAEHREVIGPFMEFCNTHQVRWCAAKPATVAAFLTECSYRGEQFALKVIEAISAFHQFNNLADPTCTRLVTAALDQIVKTEAPRWPKEDKILFARLPTQIKQRIAEREAQRDKALSQAKNQLAEERKTLNVQSKTEGTPTSNGNAAQPHTAAAN